MNCINQYINVVKLNYTQTVVLCRNDCCCVDYYLYILHVTI